MEQTMILTGRDIKQNIDIDLPRSDVDMRLKDPKDPNKSLHVTISPIQKFGRQTVYSKFLVRIKSINHGLIDIRPEDVVSPSPLVINLYKEEIDEVCKVTGISNPKEAVEHFLHSSLKAIS